MLKNDRLTKSQALPKIRQFCAYQERCHQEVKDKLYGYSLSSVEVDEILSQLISDKYLDEQRFAIQFAGGRFRMKGWGKVKIRYELKQRQVSEFCIKKALQSIDDVNYEEQAGRHALSKWKNLSSEKNIFTKRRKLMNYLLQKGFERDLSLQLMTELENKNK